jgi:hypothetical protein
VKKPESNNARLELASECLKKVAISLTTRRPKGMSAFQTDAALAEVLVIEARISAIARRLRTQDIRTQVNQEVTA